STTANIAEGYGRFHYLDNAKFCSNSRGSCWEVLDHLITASDEALLPPPLIERGKVLVHGAVKLLNGYMSYLKRAASNPDNRYRTPIVLSPLSLTAKSITIANCARGYQLMVIFSDRIAIPKFC